MAEYNLGVNYYFGKGLPQNYAKADYWYQKAAQQGVFEAEYNLGADYYKGQGVPQNSLEALHWLKKAANQNSSRAQKLIQIIERGSTG
jgi:TPR repeat protein